MAARINASEVKEIIDTDLTDSVVDAFIQYATTLVDDYLADTDLTDEALKEIERWLAAHAIASTRDRQALEEEAGPARQRFADIFGPGLNGTTYGQTAMTLDTTGTLADLSDAKKKVVIKAVTETHDFRYSSRD